MVNKKCSSCERCPKSNDPTEPILCFGHWKIEVDKDYTRDFGHKSTMMRHQDYHLLYQIYVDYYNVDRKQYRKTML